MIDALKAKLQQMKQTACPVFDYFSDGIYARELHIPKGVCLVGAKHKTNHLMMISQGVCTISNNGQEPITYEAPALIETKRGTQRAIYSIEDTIMTTFHVTDKTDPMEIGDDILEKEHILPEWAKSYLGGDK